MKITEKLALDAFKNDKQPISLLIEKSATPAKNGSVFMPALGTFTPLTGKGRDGGRICRLSRMRHLMIVCIYGSVKWKYPRSEYGVQYRFG